MKFEQLNIIPPILKALARENYVEPSPIQEKAIPPALLGRDILGCAQTGTGKTAAFAVPILQLLTQQPLPKDARRVIRALILTPTRELALQISESFQAYGRFLDLRCEVIFGGVSQVPQVNHLKSGVDILVATPGRLNDLIQQKFIDLKHVEMFVLDEADRMLDMGFIHDVKKIIALLPQKKQTLFFSATMPPEIAQLVDSLLVDPVKVAITPAATTVDAIEQSIYFVDKGNKAKLLIHLLQDPKIESALVFTRTKHGADRVVRELTRAKIPAQSIHGNKSQSARQLALSSFKNRKIRVLVATDIAARGIDIEELSHVINYDLPNIPETYVHRIGRTGRAGLSGIAISFCDIDEKPFLKDIEKLIKKQVPVVEEHPYPMEVFTLSPPKQNTRRPLREAFPRMEKPRFGHSAHKEQPAGAEEKKRDGKKAGEKPHRESAPPQKSAAKPHAGHPAPEGPEHEQKKPAGEKQAARRSEEKQAARRPEKNWPERPASQNLSGHTPPARVKEPKAPRPLLERTTTTKKPSDQFLSDKPFFRKGS